MFASVRAVAGGVAQAIGPHPLLAVIYWGGSVAGALSVGAIISVWMGNDSFAMEPVIYKHAFVRVLVFVGFVFLYVGLGRNIGWLADLGNAGITAAGVSAGGIAGYVVWRVVTVRRF
jgi:hypothetical protein